MPVLPPVPEHLAVATYDISRDNHSRLCSADGACGHGEGGCHRTEVILSWEAENKEYLPGNLVWGADPKDQFFVFNGHIWYYKPWLDTKLQVRKTGIDADKTDQGFLSLVQKLKAICPNFDINNEVLTLDNIKSVINSSPLGMPRFVGETEHFLQFEDVGSDYITIDNITKADLNDIKTSSVGPNWAPPFVLHEGLIRHNNKVYNTDLLNWQTTSPDTQSYGIVLANDTDIRFYPFESTMPSNITQAVTDCGNYFTGLLNKTFEIVYL